MKNKIIYLIFIMLSSIQISVAQDIKQYDIKESLLKNSKLAVVACDTAGRPTENIKGNYLFVVNGFEQNLSFQSGVAIIPLRIEKSGFVFLKHQNVSGKHHQLYFVYKTEKGLNPLKINVLWLLVVPLVIVFIISAIRKYIWIGVVLLIVYIFMGHSSGLSLDTFFDSLFSQFRTFVG